MADSVEVEEMAMGQGRGTEPTHVNVFNTICGAPSRITDHGRMSRSRKALDSYVYESQQSSP